MSPSLSSWPGSATGLSEARPKEDNREVQDARERDGGHAFSVARETAYGPPVRHTAPRVGSHIGVRGGAAPPRSESCYRLAIHVGIELMHISRLTSCAAVLAALAGAPTVRATDIFVNDNGDDGPGNCLTICTLRDAIAAGQDYDYIVVHPPGPVIVLDPAKGPIPIDRELTIGGPSPEDVSISGANATRIFDIGRQALVQVFITGLTLESGFAPVGGAIFRFRISPLAEQRPLPQ